MKFSIVTPSFNQAQFIEKTIKSVQYQTYCDYEYFIVDNKSTDNTGKIISRYTEYLERYISEPDSGQADAINKGFSCASGDIYAYLNSDDYYFRNTLELVAAYFNQHPEVDVVYGDCVFTDENGQFIRYFSEISDFNAERLFNYSDILMQPATFWRKEVFDKYGPFDINLHYGFDWAFWCELASRGCRIQRIPSILAANRVYPQTKTSSGSTIRLGELRRINNRYKTRLLEHAYYRYYLSDLVEKNDRELLDYLKFPLLVLMSYGNILHHLKNYNSKIIYGFLPKSAAVLSPACIKLPRLDYHSVKVKLAVPTDVAQSVTVYSSGRLIGQYQFRKGRLDLDINLVDSDLDVDIRLEFETEYLHYRSVIQRSVLFYQPKHISADLLSVKMF